MKKRFAALLCATAVCCWGVSFAQGTENQADTRTEEALLEINTMLGTASLSSADSGITAVNGGISTFAITEGSATGSNAIAIGTLSKAEGNRGLALGYNAQVYADAEGNPDGLVTGAVNGGVAIGGYSTVTAEAGTGLGDRSTVKGKYSVAIGYDSLATEANTVSFGNPDSGRRGPKTRRLVNVTDGVNDTDAATVGQLNKKADQTALDTTNSNVSALTTKTAGLSRSGSTSTLESVTFNAGAVGGVTTLTASDAVTAGSFSTSGTVTAGSVKVGTVDIASDKITGLSEADLTNSSTEAVTGKQLYATNEKITNISYSAGTGTTVDGVAFKEGAVNGVTTLKATGDITAASFNGITLEKKGSSGVDIVVGGINLTQMAEKVGVGTSGEGESLTSRVGALENKTAGIANTKASEKYNLTYETADGETKNYTSIKQAITGNETITQGYTQGQIIDVEAERAKLMEQYYKYEDEGEFSKANDVLKIVEKLNDSAYIETAQGAIETSKTTIGSGVPGEPAGIEVTTKTTEVYDAESGATKKVTENFITMNGAVNGVTIGTTDRTIGGQIQYGEDGSALKDVVFNEVNLNEIQRNTAGITNTTTNIAENLINSAGETITNVQQVNVDGIEGYTKGQYIDMEAEKAKLMDAFQKGDVTALDTLKKLTENGAVSTVQGNTTTVTTGIGSGAAGQPNGIEVTTMTKDVWNGSAVTQQTTNKITMNGDVDVKGTLSAEKIMVNGSELDLGNLASSIETTDTGILLGSGTVTITNAANGAKGGVAIKGDLSVDGTINGLHLGYAGGITRTDGDIVIENIDLTDMKDKVDSLWKNGGASDEGGSSDGGTAVVTDGVAKTATETDSAGNVTTTTVETKADGLHVKTEVTDKEGKVTSTSSKNISQSIDDLQASMNDVTSQMNDLDRKVGELDDRISDVGAMAAAMSSLKTLGYDPDAPTEISAGIGSYDHSTAYALGIFHYANRDLMFNLQYASAGNSENMVSGGVTVRLGRSGKKSEAVQQASKPVTIITEAEKPAIEARYSGKTNDFLASAAQGDYAKAETLMAPVMKQKLTKEVFEKLQTVMTEQFGTLNGLTLTEARETDQGIEVEYRADFEKQDAQLIVGYERKAGDPKIISFILDPIETVK